MSCRASQEPSSPLSSVPPSSSPSPPSSDSGLSEISDSELSVLSRSLHHSRRPYPSPSSSNRSSAKASPAPENMASPPSSNDGDDRPRKKRKLAAPKERTTERLDLRKDLTEADKPQLDRLLNALHKKRKIVVIAGAGISVAAGIPDFRSSDGLFKTLRKEHKRVSTGKDLFDASVYQHKSSTSSFHDMVRSLSKQTRNAEPTLFHHLLATLAQENRLLRLYTQNVDCIDTSLPPLKTEVPLPKKNPWPKTIQLHGGLGHMVCTKCHALSEFDAEKFNGPEPSLCPRCEETDNVRLWAEKRSHGIGRLRPRMVLYNEHNPDADAIGSCVSADLRTRPDAIIVVGTTLKVPGIRRITREMCATVRDRRDGVTIWINNDPEPIGKDLANIWDLVVQGPCDEVARHARMRKWDDPIPAYKEVSDDELNEVHKKQKQEPEVVVGTPKKISHLQGNLPTPVASPRIAPQMTIQEDSINQPSTPSKKGSKRKMPDAQVNAFEKLTTKAPLKATTKRSQSQPKKATGAKSKAKKSATAKKETNALINSNFKAVKNSSRPQPGTKFISYHPFQAPADSQTKNAINVAQKDGSHTPRRRQGKVTAIKENYLAPISPSDSRYNQSPERPAVEAITFTPVTTPVKRSPSEQLLQEFSDQVSPKSDSRPPTRHSMKLEDVLN